MTVERLAALVEDAEKAGRLSRAAVESLRTWTTSPAYASQRDAITALLASRSFDEVEDSFGSVIPFGTGGRRGPMGPGPNRINERTIAESAQGLSRHVLASRARLASGADARSPSIVIAYDTRRNSRWFAEVAASVVAGNGIRALLFDGPRSTPELSFAVRRLQASAGIVVSASHNPPSDNGFKAYWTDGGQVVPPNDRAIIEEVRKAEDVTSLDLVEAAGRGLFETIGSDIDRAYVDYCASLALGDAREVGIVFTPLHGTGTTSVYPALSSAGFSRIARVESQWSPDPDFSGVPGASPNPENPSALEAAVRQGESAGADLIMGSDPDSDRLGAVVRHGRLWQFLTGNQIGVLIFEHVARTLAAAGRLSEGSLLMKTCVTSDLFDRIAEAHGIQVQGDFLVGFKYIGEAIGALDDPSRFVFGTEESHGYLRGSEVRDKDAAQGAVLLAERAAELKRGRKTLVDALHEIWLRHGYHADLTRSIPLRGSGGGELAKTMMDALRGDMPREIAGEAVVSVVDRLTRSITDPGTGRETGAVTGAKGDILVFHLREGGSERISIRPSGTEPKIKVYVQILGRGAGGLERVIPETDARAERLANGLADLTRRA